MKRIVSFLFGLAVALTAQATVAPKSIPLWPEGVPGLKPGAGPEKMVNHRITGVHYPSLVMYAPAPGMGCGTAVIFCPGGGYTHITIGPDGGEETRFLNAVGVTVFILKYRMVEYGYPAPFQDVLRAIRLVRSRAASFGVRPDRIGLLGESAGGHLAACAATLWDDADGRTGAALDAVSARPDFVALVYPVVTMKPPYAHRGSREALLGANPDPRLVDKLSIETRVRRDMPPVFLVATMADKTVPVQNSLYLAEVLRAAGVPTEVHLYAQGSHGNSLDPKYGPTALWPQRLLDWMRFNGWLPAAPPRNGP
ncbi:MAG TPA: alpha/beta hydrolase [Opitutaceae bacterium]|nr:alpha/beta hydrolase [Opitutaceae bacterium]